MISKRIKYAVVAGACATVAATGLGFVAHTVAQSAQAAPSPSPASPAPAAPAPLAALPQSADISDVAERVVASVVNVSTTQTIADDGPAMFDPFFNDPSSPFDGTPDPRKAQSLGSGVVVSSDGKILTNAHVVKNADEIRVTLHDGTEVQAKVIGVDAPSDLAVLKLEGSHPNLVPLPFADSSKLRLGEVVLAVGNPFGVGQAVSMGIVSATGRASIGIEDYEDFIQTDAAINPGNSGGALVDMRGELVGINTAILSKSGGYQGIGFAIPTNMARPIMDALIKDGKVSRGWMGVMLAPLDADTVGKLKVSPGKGVTGVIVAQVGDQTPAAKAGLAEGDVITAIDGQSVREVGKLRNLVAAKGANVTAELAVIRGGKPRTVKITLGELPDKQTAQQQVMPQQLAPQQPRGHGRGRGQPGMHGEQIIINPDGTIERRAIP